MRNSLKWLLSLACLASFLPTAHAWGRRCVATVPVMAVPGQSFGVQSFGLASVPVQSFALTSVPVQSFALTSVPVQSFGVQSLSVVPTSQAFTAQGLDINTLLRLLGGGLTPGPTPDTSSLVTELRNNTAALKALTDAVKANTAAGANSTPTSGTGGLGQLPKIGGVNAEALQAAQIAYAQSLVDQQAQAQALASKKPAPSTSADYLTGAEKQINTATAAVLTAQAYLQFAQAQKDKDTSEIDRLTGLLKKIGQPPAK